MKKYFLKTFGCQMNVHDSEKIAGILQRNGYSDCDNPKGCDLIIFNTCSIRDKAEQKFFSELGKIKSLKRKMPSLRIAVAGCIAQQMGKEILKRAPYVDFIFGPQNLHTFGDILEGKPPDVSEEENMPPVDVDLPAVRPKGGRAWVSIMYGCDNFCSYCIVPYTRGREKSRPAANILKEVSALAVEGFKEVNLLGQNVNSYRSEINFPGLLKEIDSIPGIERIRFVTSHPRDLSDQLIRNMRDLDKVCEHIHLPLQSGSTRVLGLMNRGYSYDGYRKKIDALRREIGNISITTDIIAGFPGETDRDHAETMAALRDIEFDGIFAFKFSPRPGTEAARMDNQIGARIGSERLGELLSLQDSITININRRLENTEQEILVEGCSDSNKEVLTGRTRGNKIVNFSPVGKGLSTLSHKIVPDAGDIIKVRIVESRKHSLVGEMV